MDKPSIFEKVLALASPKIAKRRFDDRVAFSACCDDPRYSNESERRNTTSDRSRLEWKYGKSKSETANSGTEGREKQTLRNRVEVQLRNTPLLKSVLRDLQTYVPPTGYEPGTSNSEWNSKISEFIAEWDSKADLRGLKSFFDILGLIEVEKTRGGDVGIAAVQGSQDDRFLSLQPIPGARIGNPTPGVTSGDSYYPDNFPQNLRNHNRYRNGIEFSKDGRAVRVHVWRLKVSEDKPQYGVQQPTVWEYDVSYEFSKAFWFLTDSLYLDEDRGKSDFEQCLDSVESVVRTLKSTSNRLEFFSKLAGFLKGGDGDIGDLPGMGQGSESCEACGGEGCSECGPTRIDMGELLEVWGIPEGKEFEPAKFDLDSKMLLSVVNALMESAAFSVHLPPSFINLRYDKTGQGTVERGDQQKAQREFTRRRRSLAKMIAKPIVQAALLQGRAAGDVRIASIPVDELIKGEFIYPPDISVDPGREGRQLLAERQAGLIPDSIYQSKFERSPQRIRDMKNQELSAHIEDIRMHSGESDWSPSPEYVAAYLRETKSMNREITHGAPDRTPGDEG
jgi:hypothetical protein